MDASTPTPSVDQTPSPTATASRNRSVRDPGVGESDLVSVDGSLPVNATVVYRRVERAMGVNGTPPTVTVASVGFFGDPPNPDAYERALGIVTPSDANRTDLASDCGPLPRFETRDDGVSVDAGALSAAEVELALAQSFAQSLTSDVLESTNVSASTQGGATWESEALRTGVAVHVADEYARTHDVRWAGVLPSERSECLYRTYPSVPSQTGLQRYLGDRYVDRRFDETVDLTRLFAHRPRTDEQFLHGLAPATAPPTSLAVSGDTEWAWVESDRRRAGEIAVRRWLQPYMGTGAVDTAATGWGNDRVVAFEPVLGSDETGVAWILRWDTPEDADEFYSAARYVEARLEDGNVTDARLVRQGEDTVVVLAGEESFVANATVSGSSGDVTVSTP